MHGSIRCFLVIVVLAISFTAQTVKCEKKLNTTKPHRAAVSAETVTDIDGNIYETVRIGDQVWTTSNLRTTRFNDGSPIPQITGNEEWKAASLQELARQGYKGTITIDFEHDTPELQQDMKKNIAFIEAQCKQILAKAT